MLAGVVFFTFGNLVRSRCASNSSMNHRTAVFWVDLTTEGLELYHSGSASVVDVPISHFAICLHLSCLDASYKVGSLALRPPADQSHPGEGSMWSTTAPNTSVIQLKGVNLRCSCNLPIWAASHDMMHHFQSPGQFYPPAIQHRPLTPTPPATPLFHPPIPTLSFPPSQRPDHPPCTHTARYYGQSTP